MRLPDGSPVPTVLLGNKCDMLEDASKVQAELDEFCKENGFLGGFLGSWDQLKTKMDKKFLNFVSTMIW